MPKAYVQVSGEGTTCLTTLCLCGWGKISCGFSVDPLVVCGG